ncbi:MAG: hypothetical protein ACJ77W_10225 [Chloroflexota bacterium]
MTHNPDRIAVPTNGKGPHPVATSLAPLRGEPPTAEPPSAAVDPTDPALLGAVSPRQLAIGFGIVASLVLLALGRSRTRRGR